MEEHEREMRIASVRYERIISEVSSLYEKSVSKEETCISKAPQEIQSLTDTEEKFIEETESETVSHRSRFISQKFLETKEEEEGI